MKDKNRINLRKLKTELNMEYRNALKEDLEVLRRIKKRKPSGVY